MAEDNNQESGGSVLTSKLFYAVVAAAVAGLAVYTGAVDLQAILALFGAASN